jgi:DNA transformation protein and related proteins
LGSAPDNTFKEFVLDQLSALPDVRARAMFGGHGFYAGDRFFGILFEGRLYFKVDEASRSFYEKRGMPPFTYEKARQTMTMRYYEVPAEVIESRQELIEWAKRAIHVQDR